MTERTLDAFELKGPKPRTIGIFILLFIVLVILWGTFVIVPAGQPGGRALVGKCGEKDHG